MIILKIIAVLMFIIIGLIIIGCIIRAIQEWRRYNPGHNPCSRICKHCGSHQHMYSNPSTGANWWEEVYPIGNNPDCDCHYDTECRDW